MQEISAGWFRQIEIHKHFFCRSKIIWNGPKCFGPTEGQAKKQNNYLCEVEMQEISAGCGDFRQIEDP